MTAEQEKHLERIKAECCALLDRKYRAGALEHQHEYGGQLLHVPLLKLVDHAIEEAIDQVAYLLSIKEKILGAREGA